MTTDPIDYSRPVGWWCATCGASYGATTPPGYIADLCTRWGCRVIPVFKELPTPEPVEVDEVETGEAEMCTEGDSGPLCLTSVDGCVRRWPEYSVRDFGTHVRELAAASANARKKREGAK